MKIGAEPKKLAILGGLLALAGAVYLYSSRSEDPPQAAQQHSKQPPARQAVVPVPPRPDTAGDARLAARKAARGSQEFRPSLKPKRPEDRADPMTVDPTLRLDLLARLQEVKLQGSQRSLFDFSTAPPPKTPDVKVVPKPGTAGAIAAAVANSGPPPAPAKPPPPPIPLKFYGFTNPARPGPKRAFFLEGDEIHVVSEGDMIKKRYKVVRIGVNSAVVEDTQFQHQQTIPLEEQQPA